MIAYTSRDMDDINPASQEIIQTICDLEIPQHVAVAALCKAITMIATEEQLDYACVLIDDFSGRSEEDV